MSQDNVSRTAVLGIDTSNYTTSVALLRTDGTLIANVKRPLPVKMGECGLRQSDAVFAHIKNLPLALQEARALLGGASIVAVGVSDRPRNAEGSYMPCFLAGVSAAHAVALPIDVPVFAFSHQCGHLMAALYASGWFDVMDAPFGAFHVSGGTTELLRVQTVENGFATHLVGETADINAGQLIDRVGVYMGLGFPAGAALEQEALQYRGKVPRKRVAVCEGRINLSGLENLAKKMYDETNDRAKVSAFVLHTIAGALTSLSEYYFEKFGASRLLYAGGVMSNGIIKNHLSARFDAIFADPMFSSDNAVGIAELARRRFVAQRQIKE